MAGGTLLLWLVAIIYAGMFAMFLARWAGQCVSYIRRRRRASQPRAVCRIRMGR